MKGDFSRQTFDEKNHYSSVRLQQGRVQVDADWNEQDDIVNHRVEVEAVDEIGGCGGPMHFAAFHVVADAANLSADDLLNPANQPAPPLTAGDFLITAGRYYVGGTLAEDDEIVTYTTQPDLPLVTPLNTSGLYVAYVDVWQRHVTALDDLHMRESALGGPDTATRSKTIWQVKTVRVGDAGPGTCITSFAPYDAAIAPSTGQIAAQTVVAAADTDPCSVPPNAGYRGLENQFYRVEIHNSGDALDLTAKTGTAVQELTAPNQVRLSSGTWNTGDAVELFASKPGSDPRMGMLAYIADAGDGNTLTLDTGLGTLSMDDLPRLRKVGATYKWSRDNGSVATAVTRIKDNEVTVQDLGPDMVLTFAPDQWVELIDDAAELNGLPGQLLQIDSVDRARNVIVLKSKPTPLDSGATGVNTGRHPKLRRWDGVGAVRMHPPGPFTDWLDVENGIQIRFAKGSYRTGDYWTVPARTATADAQSGKIEWPSAGGAPALLLPFGIEHRYCRIAVLEFDGSKFTRIEDCRRLFPPITELTEMLYVSGDGQEAMPGDPLPQLLQVGVFNGSWPVANARVRFTAPDAGRVAPDLGSMAASVVTTITVITDADGLAKCAWKLDPNVALHSQQLEARLLKVDDTPTQQVIFFNGNLSIADQVFYDPGACGTLAGQGTVQKALARLSQLVSLYILSGNDQEVMPGATLEPLRVLAASDCGPVTDQKLGVQFTVVAGSGRVNGANSTTVTTDPSGVASCAWVLDGTTPRQEVEASLPPGGADPTKPPLSVRFTANLSLASQVAYTPTDKCPDLAGVITVEQALNQLCQAQGKEPGMKVKKVITTADEADLLNDTLIDIRRLEKGITVFCDGKVDAISFGSSPQDPETAFPDAVLGKPTCYLWIDLPYPLGVEGNFWDFGIIAGFQPLIMGCHVTALDNTIQWNPTQGAIDWMLRCFAPLRENKIADRLLAHFTLKGNFIWDEKRGIYLDGDDFADIETKDRTKLLFPSGDGRKGGNFEMWFWLVPPN